MCACDTRHMKARDKIFILTINSVTNSFEIRFESKNPM